MREVFKILDQEECGILLISGDLFDQPDIPFWLFNKVSRLFQQECPCAYICAIPGQHDLRWHTTPLIDTPIGALESIENFKIVNTTDRAIFFPKFKVNIYGKGWGEQIEPQVKMQKATSILLIHELVVLKEKLFLQQEEGSFSYSSDLLKKYPDFKYIISGDNHQTFHTKMKDRFLINPGSLMRKRKDQLEHKPTIFVFDSEEDYIEEFGIPVRPIEDVFRLDKIASDEEKKGAKELLDTFFKTIAESEESPDFLNVLQRMIKKEVTEKDMKEYINIKIGNALKKAKGGE